MVVETTVCCLEILSNRIQLDLQEHTSEKCHCLHMDSVRSAFYKVQKAQNSHQREAKGRR